MTTGRINQVTTVVIPGRERARRPQPVARPDPRLERLGQKQLCILEGTGNSLPHVNAGGSEDLSGLGR